MIYYKLLFFALKKTSFIFSFFVFFIFFSQQNLSAQKIVMDSLQNVLKLSKVDTNRVLLYSKLFRYSDSLFYGEEALKLSQKLNYTHGNAIALRDLGYYYYAKEKFDISLKYFMDAMKIAESNGYKKMLANIYKFTGFIFRPTDPNAAMEYYLKSLRLYTELKNELASSYLLSAIGNIYEGNNAIKNDNIQENSALQYYLKSLEIRQRLGNQAEIASSLNETSRIYESIGETAKVKELRKKGLELAEQSGSIYDIVYFCNLIGQDFLKSGNFNEAIRYQLRAYKIISLENNLNYLIMSEVARALANTYDKLKDYKKSVIYYKIYISCNDTLVRRVNSVNLNLLKNTILVEEEKQNILIKDAEIEKQKAIVSSQILLRNTLIIGFIVLIFLLIFIVIVFRKTSLKNTEIQINNKKIEIAYKIINEKTIAITDSIHYALRIQNATLPNLNDIFSELENSFVLYKPKDIVSGDFYWFNKKRNLVFIAAMDCTGHGVPGAFMSIIGSERLNDAVQNEDNPGKILSHLNVGIKTSLHQSENLEFIRDGMDIALCSIDLNTKILNYAGANRPIWIIRKNALVIDVIKGTKNAIGGLTESLQYFETHTIQLNEGDAIYIFTDGYADQDGGEKGKKLMTKKFREVLLEIKEASMNEQRAYLSSYFEKWKGDKEQLDDVLVIGIRL